MIINWRRCHSENTPKCIKKEFIWPRIYLDIQYLGGKKIHSNNSHIAAQSSKYPVKLMFSRKSFVCVVREEGSLAF